MRSSPTTTPVSITGWTRACLFSPRRCPADGLPSLNDLGTCGPNASVEKLRMFDLTRALARFRAFPDDVRIALEGDKPVACVGPILKLLDGEVIAGLAAGTAAEECPRDIDHMRRALALVKQRSP